MRFRSWLAAAALIVAVSLPTIVAAQSIAYTVPYGRTNMRAGPQVDFPIVAQVLSGSLVNVYGCLSDYSWCDCSVQGIRGWIAASRLEFEYAGGLVPFPNYYNYFDAPVIGFSFGYWDDYYRDRSFYRDRYRYRDRDWRDDRNGHRGPVTRVIPGGEDGFEPPASGRRYRPYSENPRGGYNQPQMEGGAAPGGGRVAPPSWGGSPPSQDIPPSSGEGGGLPCLPGTPSCQ
jgi:uncharacterized protein YraI